MVPAHNVALPVAVAPGAEPKFGPNDPIQLCSRLAAAMRMQGLARGIPAIRMPNMWAAYSAARRDASRCAERQRPLGDPAAARGRPAQ